jgi:GTP-binding protein Era
MSKFRSGFVAVIGRPNVGKSTLLNSLLGQKISIVSDKPQTTRNAIQCVLTRDDAQIVFLDTPGIHKPFHRLGEYMVKTAIESLEGVDAVLWLIEMGSWTKADEHILDIMRRLEQPILLVVNKSDLSDKRGQAEFLESVAEKADFAHILGVSALTGENLDTLVDLLIGFLPEGPKYYPNDWITGHPERFVFAEFIREQILHKTEEEIPHSIAVDIDEVSEDPERDLVSIRATIYVERDSQKGIIIGKNGRMLKAIGVGAREQIEQLLGVQVYLDLWVKVKKDWRNKPGALREFGYE